MQLAVVIPLMRPHRIAPLVENIRETTEPCNIVVIAAGECADAARDLPVTLIEDKGGTYPVRINRAFQETTEPYLHLAADDIWFHPNWFENALRAMGQLPNGSGVIATNDQHNAAGVHFLVARSYVNELGGYHNGHGYVLYPHFQHQYCDDALRATALARGKFAYANDSIVEHRREPYDEIYRMGGATGGHDHAIYVGNPELWQ